MSKAKKEKSFRQSYREDLLKQKAKNGPKEKESDIQEKCIRCGSTDFSIATDVSQARHCSKCRYKWMAMTHDQLKLQISEEQRLQLKDRMAFYRLFMDRVQDSVQEIFDLLEGLPIDMNLREKLTSLELLLKNPDSIRPAVPVVKSVAKESNAKIFD